MTVPLWLWVIVAAIVVGGIFIVARLLTRHNVATLLMTTYRRAHRTTGNHRASLKAAIDSFRDRRPFDELTDEDVAFMIDLFTDIPDPVSLAAVMQRAESIQSVLQLKDRELMRVYAEVAKARTRQS
jgi:hypothetical protein